MRWNWEKFWVGLFWAAFAGIPVAVVAALILVEPAPNPTAVVDRVLKCVDGADFWTVAGCRVEATMPDGSAARVSVYGNLVIEGDRIELKPGKKAWRVVHAGPGQS